MINLKATSFILLVIITACNSQSSINFEELPRWTEDKDNGFVKTRTVKDIDFYIKYLSPEVLAANEIKRFGLFADNKTFDSLTQLYSGIRSFIFSVNLNQNNTDILSYQAASKEEFDERVSYYYSSFSNDIIMVQENDTFNCKQAIFERNYNVSPINTFNLIFDRPKDDKKDFAIIVRDKYLGASFLQFKFSAKQINQFPSITL